MLTARPDLDRHQDARLACPCVQGVPTFALNRAVTGTEKSEQPLTPLDNRWPVTPDAVTHSIPLAIFVHVDRRPAEAL